MSLREWYWPSWCGDLTLTATDDGASVLSAVNPTPGEKLLLARFIATAQGKGWLGDPGDLDQPITIGAPLDVTGPALFGAGQGTLTVFTSNQGTLSAVIPGDTVLPPTNTTHAVTVRRPTPCCPEPRGPAEIRADKVLRTFLTPAQRATWDSDGYVLTKGNLTGHTYRIAHRGTPIARAQGRICADLTNRATLHFHDAGYPPAEEVLSAFLWLQHHEPALRNHSTCLSDRFTHVFDNPYGHPYNDGVPEARALQAASAALLAFGLLHT